MPDRQMDRRMDKSMSKPKTLYTNLNFFQRWGHKINLPKKFERDMKQQPVT